MLSAANIISAASKTTTTNGSGSIIFLLVIAVLFFLMYRFFMKPRQRAAQQQRDVLLTLEPGDEVLTGAGIFGTVQHVQGDRVTLWTGTGSTITVLRRTIARKLDDEEIEEAAGDEHDPEDHESWNDEDAAKLDGLHDDHEHEGDDEEDHDGPSAASGLADGVSEGVVNGSTTSNGAGGGPVADKLPSEVKAEDEDG